VTKEKKENKMSGRENYFGRGNNMHNHEHQHEHGEHCSCGHCHPQEVQFGDISDEQWQAMFGNWQDFINGEGEELAELKEKVKANAADEESVHLQDCLELLCQDDMLELIEHGGYNVDEKLPPEEMAVALAEEIRRKFGEFLQCMVLDDYYQLWTMVIADEQPISQQAMEDWAVYQNQGFVYYFIYGDEEDEDNDELCSVMPVELQLDFVQLEQQQWIEAAEQRDMVFNLMAGLASIYGSYPLAQLQKVWLHIGNEQAISEEVLTKCCQLAAMGKANLVIDEEMVYWDELLLDQPIEVLEGYDYYLPTLEEVMAEVEGNYLDLQSAEAKAVEEFFRAQYNLSAGQLADVMQNVRYIIKMSADQAERMEFIEAYLEGHELAQPEAQAWQELGSLVAALALQIRQWVYCGHYAGKGEF